MGGLGSEFVIPGNETLLGYAQYLVVVRVADVLWCTLFDGQTGCNDGLTRLSVQVGWDE